MWHVGAGGVLRAGECGLCSLQSAKWGEVARRPAVGRAAVREWFGEGVGWVEAERGAIGVGWKSSMREVEEEECLGSIDPRLGGPGPGAPGSASASASAWAQLPEETEEESGGDRPGQCGWRVSQSEE
jgi:hypothetical protein